MQVQHPHALSPERTVRRILLVANNASTIVGRFVHHFKDFVSVCRSWPLFATAGPLLHVGYGAREQICFRTVCVRSRVCLRALSSQVCVVISPRLCVMRVSGQPSSSSAARTSLRIAHSLLQAQRSNRRQPRGDPFSASLRALMGEGVAFY